MGHQVGAGPSENLTLAESWALRQCGLARLYYFLALGLELVTYLLSSSVSSSKKKMVGTMTVLPSGIKLFNVCGAAGHWSGDHHKAH